MFFSAKMFPTTIPRICLMFLLLKCICALDLLPIPELCSPIAEPVVLTTLGLVRGNVMTSRDNGTFYAFRGIKYAKPPIGNLRFRSPVTADFSLNIFNATSDALPCYQYRYSSIEDCLVVNVYSKMVRKAKLPFPNGCNLTSLPVLVFIVGDGFSVGGAGSDSFGPEPIMDRNVVLVTVAFRLGPFGFLSTGDSSAYGNAGMLDQVMALKWVRDNIVAFGGDPRKVTIWGCEAGGVSVALHLLSPLSRGLFSAAIAMDGSATLPWAIQRNPLSLAFKLGKPFNCSEDNTSLLVECLRKQSAADIATFANDKKDYDLLFVPFVPVVEKPHYGSFLEEEPLKLLQEGRFVKVPVISGVTRNAGFYILIWLRYYLGSSYEVMFRDRLEEVVRFLLHDDRKSANVTAAVRNEYFRGVDYQSTAAVRAGTDMCSDCYYKAGNDMLVRSLANAGVPVYMYEFAYNGSLTKDPNTEEIELFITAELPYLFYRGRMLTESELPMSHTLIDMWVNFADKHNPTPVGSAVQWTPSPNGTIRYLRIADPLTMEANYLTDRMHFWNYVVPSILRS